MLTDKLLKILLFAIIFIAAFCISAEAQYICAPSEKVAIPLKRPTDSSGYSFRIADSAHIFIYAENSQGATNAAGSLVYSARATDSTGTPPFGSIKIDTTYVYGHYQYWLIDSVAHLNAGNTKREIGGKVILWYGAMPSETNFSIKVLGDSLSRSMDLLRAISYITGSANDGYRFIDSATGNDSNDGLTPATAWATMNKMNAVTNDTLWTKALASGVRPFTVFVGPGSYGSVSCTLSIPGIKIKGFPGLRTKLYGDSSENVGAGRYGHDIFTVYAPNVWIEDLEFHAGSIRDTEMDPHSGATSKTWGNAITFEGDADYYKVRNCYFPKDNYKPIVTIDTAVAGASSGSPTLQRTSFTSGKRSPSYGEICNNIFTDNGLFSIDVNGHQTRIHDNYIKGTRVNVAVNGGAAIQIFTNSTNTSIYNNAFDSVHQWLQVVGDTNTMSYNNHFGTFANAVNAAARMTVNATSSINTRIYEPELFSTSSLKPSDGSYLFNGFFSDDFDSKTGTVKYWTITAGGGASTDDLRRISTFIYGNTVASMMLRCNNGSKTAVFNPTDSIYLLPGIYEFRGMWYNANGSALDTFTILSYRSGALFQTDSVIAPAGTSSWRSFVTRFVNMKAGNVLPKINVSPNNYVILSSLWLGRIGDLSPILSGNDYQSYAVTKRGSDRDTVKVYLNGTLVSQKVFIHLSGNPAGNPDSTKVVIP